MGMPVTVAALVYPAQLAIRVVASIRRRCRRATKRSWIRMVGGTNVDRQVAWPAARWSHRYAHSANDGQHTSIISSRGVLETVSRAREEAAVSQWMLEDRSPSSHGRDDNVLDLCHVARGGRGGLLRGAPALASVHVRRVPVPPVVRWGDRLERAVMVGRFMQELCASRNVHHHTRPGSRSLISCSSQTLPSGSLNEAYEP